MGVGQALTSFWSARSQRERAVLAAGGVLVAAAALYAFLWAPGLESSKRLSAALPRLRAQLEDMRLQQKEIEGLRKALGGAPQSADLRSVLQASVQRSPFAKSVERIERRSDDEAVVVAAAVDFDQWLGWVGGLKRDLGIRLEAAEITALGEPGMVRVQATFATGRGRAS